MAVKVKRFFKYQNWKWWKWGSLTCSSCALPGLVKFSYYYTFTTMPKMSKKKKNCEKYWYTEFLLKLLIQLLYQANVLMSRAFANALGDRGSIPGRVILKIQKRVHDTAILNTQHYKVMLYSHDHDQLYKHIIHLHAEHKDTMKTSDTVPRKIYLSLYSKGLCVRGSWRPNRTATYWPPLLWPSVLCLSRSPGLLNRGPTGPLCWALAFSTASCHQRVWSPNWSGLQLVQSPNWSDFPSSPSYIIVQRPPSCGRHKLHSFNPSTVKVIISWSTGCTCYLQRCISYFESPAGS